MSLPQNSGIESLVEELCSRLKDIQNKQKGKLARALSGVPVCRRHHHCRSSTPVAPSCLCRGKAHAKEARRLPVSRVHRLALLQGPGGNVGAGPAPGPLRRPPAPGLSRRLCARRYYEAFPPLSEKPVCLQEIMTVWNKARACGYSASSSSAAPQTSTDTSSPKDCNSEGEAAKEQQGPRSAGGPAGNRGPPRRTKKEKENQQHEKKSSAYSKRPGRHRPEGKYRPRSWSSGSSEAGSSSSGNQGEAKAPRSRAPRVPHRSREAAKNKRTRNSAQAKAPDREEPRQAGGSSSSGAGGCPARATALHRKGKRPLKEVQKEAKEATLEALKRKEYMEEPLWYTEPIADYFVPCDSSSRRSKLETKYRSEAPAWHAQETIQGVCVASEGRQRAQLAAGSFVDGHFVEGPGEEDEEEDDDDNGEPEPCATSSLPPPEGGRDLDDEHLSEFTHFYEVDIYRSMLDTSASESLQESRILNMIRQTSRERRAVAAGRSTASDAPRRQGKSAIRAESSDAAAPAGSLAEDLESMAQLWGCCSPSTSEDIDGESFAGESPVRLSPLLDSVSLALSAISGYAEEPAAPEASSQARAVNASCFSLFELQYDRPAFSFPSEPPPLAPAAPDGADPGEGLHPLTNKQSRLLIWTKNSAFEEAEHCSNLSTRTCSPWSHSEETRSDTEQAGTQTEDPGQVCGVVPPLPGVYLEDELLDFLQGSVHEREDASESAASSEAFAKKSKLESVCGIALEEDESGRYGAVAFPGDRSPGSHDYSSGIIKDIWTAVEQDAAEVRQGRDPFPDEAGTAYCHGGLEVQAKGPPVQAPQKKAVQRSEYHLWDSKKEERDLAKNRASGVDGAGDYTTPSKPWDLGPDRKGTSFLLGGVYGELKSLGGDESWAVLPPGHGQGSLLQCAASDVLTIAGGCFAPGHRPLWRPLVSFGQSEQAARQGPDGPNKGFSLIFHEDLLGPYGGLCGQEPGGDYPFASFSLDKPFSQVLHVECSFESEDVASFSPGFKPRSILCSEPEAEASHSRLYGINRTQYRAIRISPRTHFRPISASELSPAGASDSDAETDREEAAFLAPADVFDDPQADLKPLEEDAECEGPYYGKSELESGKFLPRLKKSGMEKSAQTSLDSQEGSGSLPETGPKPAGGGPRPPGTASDRVGNAPEVSPPLLADPPVGCRRSLLTPLAFVLQFPLWDGGGRGQASSQQSPGWWQSTLGSPLLPASQCPGKQRSPGCTGWGVSSVLCWESDHLTTSHRQQPHLRGMSLRDPSCHSQGQR